MKFNAKGCGWGGKGVTIPNNEPEVDNERERKLFDDASKCPKIVFQILKLKEKKKVCLLL